LKVIVDLHLSKFFGLVTVRVSGELKINHSGGDFIKNRIRNKIFRSIEDSGAVGSATVGGEARYINQE
jgi:hypothetical protein